MRRHPFFVDFMEIAGAQKKGIFAEVLFAWFLPLFSQNFSYFHGWVLTARFNPKFALRTRTLCRK